MAIIKYNARALEEFCKQIEMSPKTATEMVLPNCFAFLLPIEAGCLGIKYEAKAEDMKMKISNFYTALEQKSYLLRNTSSVIAHVLENVVDRPRFAEICGFETEIADHIEMIDCLNFDKCLKHLRSNFSTPSNQSILTFFCSQKNYANFIEKLLLAHKKKIQLTSLKEHKMLFLLQYCVLVEKLFDYLNDDITSSDQNIKSFIVREITNFLCFLLLDETFGMKLRCTATSFLFTFLKKILPQCASDLKPFLNKIVSSLVSICKKSKGLQKTELEAKCFSIIEYLVFTQQAALEDEIAKMDKFPDGYIFDDLRVKQIEIKYKDGNFSLIQEIEHFLTIKRRKIEGLLALREQLAERKNELKALFDEMSSSLGFTEDGENSLLHKLIRSLIGYTRNINDQETEARAVEAVKCLGEIGNYDLSTMVFITEDHQSDTIYHKIESLAQCQKLICSMALDQMETLILHHNPKIFEAASDASYHMLSSASSQGYQASVYLRPFQTNTITSRNLFYEKSPTDKTLNFVVLLKEEEYSTYKTWIKRVTGLMLTFAGDKKLEQVSNTQKSFAELMAPLMMQLLLCYNDPTVNESINAGINYFFEESSEKLNYPERVNEGSMFLSKLAIRQMLKLTECIRTHCQEYPKSSMVAKLNLNYLSIAKAAKHCEAFFTAELYCEMWAEKRLQNEAIPYSALSNNKTLQEIMYDALTAIGINDASCLFVNPTTKRPLYLQTSNHSWQNVLEHDATMADGQTDLYMKLLNDMGLHFLTQKLTESCKDQKLKSHQYECLWRLCNWDVLIECDAETSDTKVSIDHRNEFEKFHYLGLKCLKMDDELGMKTSVYKGRKSILYLLQQESLECTKNLYKFLSMSQMMQQIEDFAEVRFRRMPKSSEKMLAKWDAQNQLPHTDFKLIEPILSQRNSIFDTANIRTGKRTWVPEALQSNMLYIVKEASDASCTDDAFKMMAKMRALTNLTPSSKAEILVKEAQLSFKTNLSLAKHCLKRVLEEPEFEREHLMRGVVHRLYGEILAENHTGDIQSIFIEHFDKSIKLLEKYAKHHNKSHLVADLTYSQLSQDFSQPMTQESADVVDEQIKKSVCVFDIVAKYYDRQYVALCDYIDSPDFKNKKSTYENNKIKLANFEQERRNNRDAQKSYIILKKTLEIDEVEIKESTKTRTKAANKAMFYYLRGSINDSCDNVLSIFRIISIWMSGLEASVTMKMLKESLMKIASHKFIVALPQLVVRLNDRDDDESNNLLRQLLERCCIDHPHHALPLILALKNSYADSDGNSEDEPRVIGAKKFWQSLKLKPQAPQLIMAQMEKMSAALINLANDECSEMSQNHKFVALTNLKYVQCPTMEIPIMKDGNYKNCVTSVVKWYPEIEKVGGINAPKKIKCLCSDGVTRPQLVKGKDDMRQDAVMEQVFGVVNQFLRDNKETKKRHARVRTYKVVPLSRVSHK